MHKTITSIFITIILLTISGKVCAKDIQPDVTSYHVTIDPNIDERSISGSVMINFLLNSSMDSVIFNSGNLEIDTISGDQVKGFKKVNHDLIIYLSKRTCKKNEIVIDYHGHPKKGLIFDPEHNQKYTLYFTSDWMICNDSPEDKALFYLDITVPIDKTCIASGEFADKVQQNDKMLYSYQQNTESPSYTYGFAIGNYNKAEVKYGDVILIYYSQDYTSDQLMKVFKETPAMISFYEEKSGVKYFQTTYSQILTGKHYQEMSGY